MKAQIKNEFEAMVGFILKKCFFQVATRVQKESGNQLACTAREQDINALPLFFKMHIETAQMF